MKKELKYKIGDRVFYAIIGNIYFIGTVIKAEVKKGQKPYTITADDNGNYYANEEYLFPYKN